MKLLPFVIVLLLAFQGIAQKTHFYKDSMNHFGLTLPDSVKPVVLNPGDDIKSQTDPFTIKAYIQKPMVSDSMPDDCYAFVKSQKTKSGVAYRRYDCMEGAAGHAYYNYLFKIACQNRIILLKFLNVACNVCTDDQGNPLVYNETISMKWMMDIVDSLKPDTGKHP